jgi:hypothetical protein
MGLAADEASARRRYVRGVVAAPLAPERIVMNKR